jgi:putative acetyltransferase
MSTDELTLRPIEPRDDAAVASIIRTVMPEFGADGPGFAIHDKEVGGMSAAYSRPGCGYWVVERAGRVVGRGKGVGERLLRQCLAFAREAGYRTCYLETLTHMTAAQKLYRRLGFQALSSPMGATGHFGCDHWYALDLQLPR